MRENGNLLAAAVALLLAGCGGAGAGTSKDLAETTGRAEVVDALNQATTDVRQEPPVLLLENGKSTHSIVLQSGASPSELYAADELQSHFKACTGVELPIVQGDPGDEGPLFVLGRGPAAQALGVDPDDESLGDQGYLLRTVHPHIVIAGASSAGTLYGVHRFLENYLAVRWYAPGITSTPALTDLAVPPVDRLVRPPFLWRQTSYKWPGKGDDFVARMAGNGGDGGADHKFGIQYAHDGRAHSYFWFVHPDEFFEEHPEYFSEIGGVRTDEETQLCLTNPDVLEIVTERMLKRMEEKPHDQQHNFSQMDRYNYCQCDKCTEMNEELGTTGGTQFWFVNELAKRTSKVYPDKLVGTLAYMYTEEPPKEMEMHPNVAVWLCHMFPSCDSHPIATCPNNADYKRRAESWSEITQHLYIWHYIVDFMHYYNPFPNFRAMSADVKFYRDIGVEGIYLQGMSKSGGGGEFSLLRPYYGMKLLWDPDQDPEELRRDFLQGYYGAAAEPIEEYVELLLTEATDKNVHMHLYTNPAQGYLPDSVVAKGESLFDQAESLVKDNAELLERVRVARMPLVYARLFPRNGYEIKNGKLIWGGEIASPEEVVEFLDRMEAHGFESLREVGGDPEYLALMYSIFNSDPQVKEIGNGHLTVEVLPNLAGRALRITDVQSGKSITAYNVPQVLYFPFAGGLEDRVGGIFEFYGWVEPATVTDHGDDTITTSVSTVNGYLLQRTLALEPGQPILHVKTVLTNPGDGQKEPRLRSHLELNLGDLHETRLKFTSLSGEEVDKDMTGIIAGLREGTHFYADDAPEGSWTFSGSKGLEVTQSFDNEQVDFTWAYAYPETLGELEIEVWSPKTTLGPGESMTLEHDIEVRPVSSDR